MLWYIEKFDIFSTIRYDISISKKYIDIFDILSHHYTTSLALMLMLWFICEHLDRTKLMLCLFCCNVNCTLWWVMCSVESFVVHCVPKNIPDIFDCKLKTNYQILIIFGTDIRYTTFHQMTIQFLTSPNICSRAIWGKTQPAKYHFLSNAVWLLN